MSRPHIHVRRVTPELEADFASLWSSARVEAGSSVDAASRSVTEDRVHMVLRRDDVRAYLALTDEDPVGFMVLTQSPLSSLTESPCVSIDQLYVTPRARRMGTARALLTAAAAYADLVGAEQIASSVPAQGREANRFFARLGFSSYVVRRVTYTAALRRKLAGQDPKSPMDRALVQRRRSLRARATRSAALVRG